MGDFKNVASYPPVRIMLSNMLKIGKETIIESEKAMRDNAPLYRNAFDEFMNITQ